MVEKEKKTFQLRFWTQKQNWIISCLGLYTLDSHDNKTKTLDFSMKTHADPYAPSGPRNKVLTLTLTANAKPPRMFGDFVVSACMPVCLGLKLVEKKEKPFQLRICDPNKKTEASHVWAFYTQDSNDSQAKMCLDVSMKTALAKLPRMFRDFSVLACHAWDSN